MSDSGVRVRRTLAAYRARRSGTGGERAFLVYAGALLLLIVVAPVTRALLVVMTDVDVLSVLAGPSAHVTVALVAGCVLGFAGLFGAARGPAQYPPFLAWVLTANSLPRRSALLRSFLGSTLVVMLLMITLSSLPAVALVLGGAASWVAVGWFVGAVALFAIITSVVWAAGQRLGMRRAWILVAIIGAAVGATATFPGLLVVWPWGWVGLAWPSHVPAPAVPLALLSVGAAGAALFIPSILSGVSGPALVDQARRWQSATTAAVSGDPSLALATFRVLPQLGRRWVAVLRHAPLGVTFWWSDLVGAARTPARATFAAIGLIAAGWLFAAGAGQHVGAWVSGGFAAVLAFSALGAFSDGLRHASEAYGAPTLYGGSRSSLVVHHAWFPFSLSAVLLATGGALGWLGGAPATGVLLATLIALPMLLVRVFDSAKGPLPPSLLSPIPTPFGDLSGLVILVWQADALLLTFACGAGILGISGISGIPQLSGGMIATIVGTTVIAALIRHRYKRL